MTRQLCTRLLAAAAIMLCAGVAPAADQAHLAQIFQDNMVLQRDKAVPVWGWAAPGSNVEVAFGGQKKNATADSAGYWKIALDAMPASADGRELTARIGDTTVTRKDVLVGEVWLAAGQSNMNHGGPDRDTGVYPHHVSTGKGTPPIRIIKFGTGASLDPVTELPAVWRKDSPWTTLADDPAPRAMNMAQYFARVVRDALGVPVGIIHVAVSGTNQAAWMARPTLESFGSSSHDNFYQQFFATMAERLGKSKGDIKTWDDFAKAQDEWLKNPTGRWPGYGARSTLSNYPTALYNTRIHPVAPYALRGAIWHQGESGPGGAYSERLAAMINQWRELFGQDFYFLWGTLSRITTISPPLEPKLSWFYRSNTNLGIRRGLEAFGNDKKVDYVELYDVGDEGTHFMQKAESGRRMGLAALTVAYGEKHIYTGPRMIDLKLTGNTATMRFAHVGEGIAYRPSIDGISGFTVAGKDGEHHWANVKVTGKDSVELASPGVTEITGLSYGYSPNPYETLINSAGIPASPFGENVGRLTHGGVGTPLVSGGKVSLVHIRKDGYVFKALGDAKVDAYISKDWPAYEVLVDGQPIEASATDKDGRKFVTIDAPAGKWIIVAAKGKAGEFTKVNRY